ncbi:hypothetical protein TeGR_g14640 [Tetraparma gracilis]|uniref:Uncharacterized protein n=1 Tax=Tetraparma gracilis TaxID=2962635 RepID=A0ABQ6MQH2_9STRA|nr:hypothetical protein TeGR_g14640 [Tetraparma gracilis]
MVYHVCTACSSGYAASSRNYNTAALGCSDISSCNPGKYIDDDAAIISNHDTSGDCTSCKLNTFANETGTSSCKDCAWGEFSPAGASACSSCPAGYVCAGGTTTACDAGTYSSGGSNCNSCEVGYKCPGASDHTLCSAGSYQNETAQDECKACPGGKLQADEGASLCNECPAGYFCPEGSKTTIEYYDRAANDCFACPAGKFSTSGAQSIDGCEDCTRGFVSREPGMGYCDPCTPGKHASADNAACTACEAGTYSGVAAFECEGCEAGKYAGSSNSDTCVTCADNKDTDGTEGNSECMCKGGFETVGSECKCAPGYTLESGRCVLCAAGFYKSGCYTEAACTHPNRTTTAADFDLDNQCKEGHTGPICNVCLKGYAKSVTGECDMCVYESSVPDEMYAFVAIVGVVTATILACVRRRIKKKQKKRKERLAAGDELGGTARQPPQTLKKHWIERARTKVKILTSFYQIVSQFESILNVRYPKAFEEFGRLVSKFANLDALNLTKVGCLVQTNFYHKLVLSTMGPLCVSVVIGLGALVMKKRAKDHTGTQVAVDGAVSLFLGLTYLVFSSVSTTVFDTFNCKSFGDDERAYMMSDQSVDCGTPDHIWYQAYAGVMMLVYPVGIPTLYGALLWKARVQLQEEGREGNEKLYKIAFLWQDYEPELWWFEVFDCVRRLSLTGLLVFVFKGQASQIVVAMVLASLSVVAFVHWRPFVKDANDNLAIVSQIAIFFTLLSGLLRKLDVDKTDEYDQATFGAVLIFVNSLGIVMVVASQLVKPFTKIFNKLTSKHLHAAPLTGVGEEHADWVEFERYFRRLAVSDEREAGWELMGPKDWGWKKKVTKEWLEEMRAVGEWS